MCQKKEFSEGNMKVLVIPDVHLKPWMFHRAAELMKENIADKAVCLMDIADNWVHELDLDLYMQTYDAAIRFAKDFPDTLWCYGNHDVCYLWNMRETGYSHLVAWTVCEKLGLLKKALPDERQLAYIHRVGSVLFSHAGLTDTFARHHIPAKRYSDVDAVLQAVNRLGPVNMWQDMSPIWYKPRYQEEMYKSREFLQVTGHTPAEGIKNIGNLVLCDTFSTYRDGKTPIGTREYLVVDTDTCEYHGVC